MSDLLEKVKANLILEHSEDDELLERLILTALSYAESYQHLTEGYYSENEIPPPRLNKQLSCLPVIFMKVVTAQQQVSFLIMSMPVVKSGIQSICYSD